MKLYSAVYGGGHPFHELSSSHNSITVTDPDHLKKNDGFLVIWGGGDISPSIYNKPVSQHTYAGKDLSSRDKTEVALAKRALELGMPIIGVCRGAQLLCALAGGYLIQHVNNHGGRHEVVTMDGSKFYTNSIHHQMMYPFNVKHELRAWMEKPLSDVHFDVDTDVDVPCEPEYVYFPEVKGYAVQWHPEGMASNSQANMWLLDDIKRGLNV